METLSLSQDLFPNPLENGQNVKGMGPKDAGTCLQINPPQAKTVLPEKYPLICLF